MKTIKTKINNMLMAGEAFHASFETWKNLNHDPDKRPEWRRYVSRAHEMANEDFAKYQTAIKAAGKAVGIRVVLRKSQETIPDWESVARDICFLYDEISDCLRNALNRFCPRCNSAYYPDDL